MYTYFQFTNDKRTKTGKLPLYSNNMGKIGYALKTGASIKPVYVSIGHKISLDTACMFVEQCCEKYRIPEPVRQVRNYSERKNFHVVQNWFCFSKFSGRYFVQRTSEESSGADKIMLYLPCVKYVYFWCLFVLASTWVKLKFIFSEFSQIDFLW